MRKLLDITRALGDETRVRALLALRDGELCLCHVIGLLELAPSTVSRHLDLLVRAGLVERRKDGRWAHFRLAGREAPPVVRHALRWVLETLGDDATIARDGRRYVMFLKDETRYPPAKNLRLATADAPGGAWGRPSPPITGSVWAEGPTAITIGGTWFVYFDAYAEGRYGLVTSKDLVVWQDESARLRIPKGHRHGSVIRVPRAILDGLVGTRPD